MWNEKTCTINETIVVMYLQVTILLRIAFCYWLFKKMLSRHISSVGFYNTIGIIHLNLFIIIYFFKISK